MLLHANSKEMIATKPKLSETKGLEVFPSISKNSVNQRGWRCFQAFLLKHSCATTSSLPNQNLSEQQAKLLRTSLVSTSVRQWLPPFFQQIWFDNPSYTSVILLLLPWMFFKALV